MKRERENNFFEKLTVLPTLAEVSDSYPESFANVAHDEDGSNSLRGLKNRVFRLYRVYSMI